DDARSLDLHAAGTHVGEGPLAVDGLAQGVDDATQEAVATRHREDLTGGLHRLAFGDLVDLTEHHGADGLFVEVEGETDGPVLELEHLVDRAVGKTRNTGDAVADLEHAADLRR